MIIVENLKKEFTVSRRQKKTREGFFAGDRIQAVDDVSFTCKPGRIFTLLGPNGAGKTTALRLIATLLKPTSGRISVAGFDTVQQSQEVRRHLGFLTGTTKLYERLTPSEVVKYYADLHDMDSAVFKRRREEIFALLGMNDFADQRIGKLSTGMKQKTSIARTIIHDPDIIVFDEPTTGLDVITSRHIIELIRMSKSAGKTVVFSTHIMGEVSLLSDDLALIHNGKLRYLGEFDDFQKNMKRGSLEEEFIRLVNGEER